MAKALVPNIFISGILRIVLLEASCALLIISRTARASARRLKAAFVVIAALSLFSFANCGELHGGGSMVHHWEQYHFYFGAKYLREVGYFDLYKALLLADSESLRVTRRATVTRDLTTFEETSIRDALADAGRVRAAFGEARWTAFKSDWVAMDGRSWDDRILDDHGNTGSPAWALFAAPLATLAGATRHGQEALAWVDIVLMVVMFALIAGTFGGRAACIALTLWALTPFCFDYLAGSLLRFDWLFAVGMCLCFYKRGRPFVAGGFLGYAIASKLFPVFFGVTWAVSAIARSLRSRRIERGVLQFGLGVALAIALSFALSSAMFGGPRIWAQYAKRVEVTATEKFYANQYSFRTVFIQAVETSPGELVSGWAFPEQIQQANPRTDIAQHRWTFLIAQLSMSALIALALTRRGEVEALAMGPFLAYVWLVLNAYYWNMLAFAALVWVESIGRRRDGRLMNLIGLHVLWGAYYLYLHYNPNGREGYFVALCLFFLIVFWAISESVGGRAEGLRIEGRSAG